MSRFVRVVEIVPSRDGDDEGLAEALRGRARRTLPPRITAGVVRTGAGVQLTLTTRYRPLPGSHRRAVRTLSKHLSSVLNG